MRLQEFHHGEHRVHRVFFSVYAKRDFVLSAHSAVIIRQNKSPFAIALGDWFALRTYFLSSKASPNDSGIVIIVIIIVIGEAYLIFHIDRHYSTILYCVINFESQINSLGLETHFGKLYPVETFRLGERSFLWYGYEPC